VAKVTLDLAAIEGLAARAAEGGLREALGEGERILKDDILNRPGSGRVYGKHQASAPGEPPAPDLGHLRANTNADPTLRQEGDETIGKIDANAAYAEALEKGTERMAARPYFGLLASDHADDLHKAFVKGARE
jgi:hypothetical protein